jgi:hypothetical protein
MANASESAPIDIVIGAMDPIRSNVPEDLAPSFNTIKANFIAYIERHSFSGNDLNIPIPQASEYRHHETYIRICSTFLEGICSQITETPWGVDYEVLDTKFIDYSGQWSERDPRYEQWTLTIPLTDTGGSHEAHTVLKIASSIPPLHERQSLSANLLQRSLCFSASIRNFNPTQAHTNPFSEIYDMHQLNHAGLRLGAQKVTQHELKMSRKSNGGKAPKLTLTNILGAIYGAE